MLVVGSRYGVQFSSRKTGRVDLDGVGCLHATHDDDRRIRNVHREKEGMLRTFIVNECPLTFKACGSSLREASRLNPQC